MATFTINQTYHGFELQRIENINDIIGCVK